MELSVNKIYKLFKRAKQYKDRYNDRIIRIRAGLNQFPSIHYCFGLPVLISKANVTTTANITQLLLSGLRVKGIFKIWFFFWSLQNIHITPKVKRIFDYYFLVCAKQYTGIGMVFTYIVYLHAFTCIMWGPKTSRRISLIKFGKLQKHVQD